MSEGRVDGGVVRGGRVKARVAKYAEGVDPDTGTPYEVVEVESYILDGKVLTDPEEIAEMERRLAAQRGQTNGTA